MRKTSQVRSIAVQAMSLTQFIRKVQVLVSWLYPEIYPYRWRVVGSWLLLALLSAASASPVVLAKKVVEDFQHEGSNFTLSAGLLAAVVILINVLGLVGSCAVGIINFQVRHSLEIKFARRLANMPLSYYEGNASGTVSLTPFTEIPLLTSTINIFFRNFLQAGMTAVLVLGVIFLLDLSLGLLSLLLIPLFFLGSNYMGKRLQRGMSRTFARVSQLHSSLLEDLLAVKSIRTLGISEDRLSRLSKIADETLSWEMKTILTGGVHRLIVELVLAAGLILLLVVLRSQFVGGTMSLALCTAATAGFWLLASEVKKVVAGVTELRKIAGATSHLAEFLEEPDALPLTGGMDGPAVVREVRLENITFSYDGRSRVLDGLDMTFRLGEITGIIGESGAGKSTLADLILRLRYPESGRILANGTDITAFAERWFRKTFGFVDQTPFLFNASIRENFLIPCPTISEEEIERCLKMARAHDFVAALPDGLDSSVGEGGGLLSVGEQQRIALARALARGPTVLVLDEVTSALDRDNEMIILDALRTMTPAMVLIVISHKRSVTSFCDKIYLLKDGAAHQVTDISCQTD